MEGHLWDRYFLTSSSLTSMNLVDFDGFSTPTYDNLVQSTWNPSFDFSTDVVLDCQSQIAASRTAWSPCRPGSQPGHSKHFFGLRS
jgi:hypothetical protein